MSRRKKKIGSVSPRRHHRGSSELTLSAENGFAHQTTTAPTLSSRFAGIYGKKSPLRLAVNSLRLLGSQAVSICRRQGPAGAAVSIATCVVFLWGVLHVSGAYRRSSVSIAFDSRSSHDGRKEWVSDNQHRRKVSSLPPAASSDFLAEDDDGSIGPRLAYGIMVYQRKGHTLQMTLNQFERMFNALYDEENTYVIHVDVKSDAGLLVSISDLIKGMKNVHEIPSVSVSWGGVTVVERTLALMQKARDEDDSWRFFINLGHEDYPSASQSEMRRWLKHQPDGTNFIKCWPIEGHNFFGQMERHESRVKDVHVDNFIGEVREYRSLSGRQGSAERPESGYKFFKSLQQTMLSRELCEYAVESAEARRLLLYMATSKAPDELYFPTLTQLDDRFSSMATCEDTRHFSYWIRPGGSWHPEYLTLDHLPLVLNATEFYIRKVDVGQGSGPLLDVLDILRDGQPLENGLFLLKTWLNRKESDGVSFVARGGPLIEFDGTSSEALEELDRRQSEVAETQRALFMNFIMSRRAKRRDIASSPPRSTAKAFGKVDGRDGEDKSSPVNALGRPYEFGVGGADVGVKSGMSPKVHIKGQEPNSR